MSDLISRKKAIEALGKRPTGDTDWDLGCRNQWDWDTEILRTLPSVEPEREMGWWQIKETAYEDVEAKCSCCGFETLVNQPGNGLHMVNDLHFCPNCGTKMDWSDYE